MTNPWKFACLLFAASLAARAQPLEFYVSPTGSDTAAGTEAHPFATLERARDAVRASRTAGESSGAATIWLEAGTFRRTATFALDDRDSETTYRPVPGARASLVGSVAIPPDAVKPVTDPAILARLLPKARGHVMQIDLHALGVTDFGQFGPRGFRRPYLPAPVELFINYEPMMVAQWPNPGQPGIPIGKVLDPGSITRKGELPLRGGTFEFSTDRPERWRQAHDIWITGFFANGYADDTVKIKSIDLQHHTITTVQPHMYGFESGKPWNRWVALNLLEEIDLPGEFYADRHTGLLYFLPPAGVDLAQARLEVTVLDQPLVAIEGAHRVVFRDLTLECSRGIGVYLERGGGNRIRNCTLRDLGIVAVCIGKGVTPDPNYQNDFTGRPLSRGLGSWHEHIYANTTYDRDAGTDQGVVDCDIYNIGQGGVSLGGGDRVSLAPAGNFVTGCRIHDFNRWGRTYKGAVNIDGVGNRVTHCVIYDAPGVALYLHGNDHLIQFNDISRVMLEGNDHGAFYMGRDPSERGNVLRYNYWHDIGLGPQAHETYAIYLDDAGGDSTRVYGNVFYRAGHKASIFLNGGSDIAIYHNLFVDCDAVLRMRGPSIWLYHEDRFEHRLAAVHYHQPPWTKHYPGFSTYLADRPQMPRDDALRDNLIVRCGPLVIDAPKYIHPEGNVVTDHDPPFVRIAGGKLQLLPDQATGIPGFEPIPFSAIGLESPAPPP